MQLPVLHSPELRLLVHACCRYAYVVSCQVYGTYKKKNPEKQADIDLLMKLYPHLRVAYIDFVPTEADPSKSEPSESVLLRYDPFSNTTVEVYRVK